MNCRICSIPLKPTQGRYCSRACANRGKRRLLPRACPACDRALTYQQLRKKNRYCSPACWRAQAVMPTPVLDAVLAILRANTGWYLTFSDLAVWVYGHDDEDDVGGVRNHVYRLRRLGYVLESRPATWLPGQGAPRAYRLVSEPATQDREEAA